MIVVDTSALVAIALGEPQALEVMRTLHAADRVLISAATVTETLIVAAGRSCKQQMAAVFDRFGIVVEPLTEARARAAATAHRRYGKGWHAARLNYGDTFAYALAQEYDCPLLFVGNDFALTDVRPALV